MSSLLVRHIHTQKRNKIYLMLRAIPNDKQRYRAVRSHAHILVKLNETLPCECKWCGRMRVMIYGAETEPLAIETRRERRAVL